MTLISNGVISQRDPHSKFGQFYTLRRMKGFEVHIKARNATAFSHSLLHQKWNKSKGTKVHTYFRMNHNHWDIGANLYNWKEKAGELHLLSVLVNMFYLQSRTGMYV